MGYNGMWRARLYEWSKSNGVYSAQLSLELNQGKVIAVLGLKLNGTKWGVYRKKLFYLILKKIKENISWGLMKLWKCRLSKRNNSNFFS